VWWQTQTFDDSVVVVAAPATVVVPVEESGELLPAPSATAAVTPAASVAIAPTSASIRLILSLRV
jgi:hypothetical protein